MTAVTDHVIPGPSAPEGWIAGTWTIDPAHTTVSFVVRHLMSRVRGTFSEVSGQIITCPDLSGSTANATIAVSSVGTGNEMRDNHLRSADFFEAERYPVMSFVSTGEKHGLVFLPGERSAAATSASPSAWPPTAPRSSSRTRSTLFSTFRRSSMRSTRIPNR